MAFRNAAVGAGSQTATGGRAPARRPPGSSPSSPPPARAWASPAAPGRPAPPPRRRARPVGPVGGPRPARPEAPRTRTSCRAPAPRAAGTGCRAAVPSCRPGTRTSCTPFLVTSRWSSSPLADRPAVRAARGAPAEDGACHDHSAAAGVDLDHDAPVQPPVLVLLEAGGDPGPAVGFVIPGERSSRPGRKTAPNWPPFPASAKNSSGVRMSYRLQLLALCGAGTGPLSTAATKRSRPKQQADDFATLRGCARLSALPGGYECRLAAVTGGSTRWPRSSNSALPGWPTWIAEPAPYTPATVASLALEEEREATPIP